jgi:deferrochelatase/peroxidase EfeB
MASARFHRVLRRGREYGTAVTPEQAIAGGVPAPSGLQFACLNANIGRQFEFVQGAWLMSAKFNGLQYESDPLLGNRVAAPNYPDSGVFSMPTLNGPNRVLKAIPQFITVRGGAYFFMPGLAALRYIAGKRGRA